jgi:hypothetical protein
LAGLAGCVNRPHVPTDDPTSYGESKASTAHAAGPYFVGTPETIEDVLQFVFSHPDS